MARSGIESTIESSRFRWVSWARIWMSRYSAGIASSVVATRRRPVWAVWTIAGLAFLLAWPTKWPQYTLVVRVPLAAMAGMGLDALWERERWRFDLGRGDRPPRSSA